MERKKILVTGANSGIGKVTCLNLAKMGHTVLMVCRDRKKGWRAQRSIVKSTGNTGVYLFIADLASFKSIQNAIQWIYSEFYEFDVLINNAGTFQAKRRISKDGLELTFAVNYFAPFFLTTMLLDLLKQGRPSRIINVTSGMHKGATIDVNDLQGKKKEYNGMKVYASSKLALILYTYALARRLKAGKINDITINAVHPGFIRTNIAREGGNFFHRYLFHYFIRPLVTESPAVGAKGLVHLATSSKVENISGKYFVKKRPAFSSKISYDTALQDALWEKSIDIIEQKLEGKWIRWLREMLENLSNTE